MRWLDSLSWTIVVVLCVTLGLAPFVPEPHILEKLKMLLSGGLTRSVDIFDLLFHGLPWLIAGLKAVRTVRA